jgi:hypothetical protein
MRLELSENGLERGEVGIKKSHAYYTRGFIAVILIQRLLLSKLKWYAHNVRCSMRRLCGQMLPANIKSIC